MILLQTPQFKRRVKKFHKKEKQSLDKAIKTIVDDPDIGVMKTGDLAGLQVHKYKHEVQQLLMAYRFNQDIDTIELIDVGTHENFYRDLKKS